MDPCGIDFFEVESGAIHSVMKKADMTKSSGAGDSSTKAEDGQKPNKKATDEPRIDETSKPGAANADAGPDAIRAGADVEDPIIATRVKDEEDEEEVLVGSATKTPLAKAEQFDSGDSSKYFLYTLVTVMALALGLILGLVVDWEVEEESVEETIPETFASPTASPTSAAPTVSPTLGARLAFPAEAELRQAVAECK